MRALASLPLSSTLLEALPQQQPARPEKTNNEVWIALHFPNLALDVSTFDPGLPAVVLDQQAGQQRVHAACPVAMHQGISPGMSLNSAHALCRNLSIQLRNPDVEQRQLQTWMNRLRVFTPRVASDNDDALLLEVSASQRLFGGLEHLLQKIRAEFSEQQNTPQLSLAPCPSAALLLARNGLEPGSDLGNIPLRAAELSTKLIARLERCGLRTLRDLYRLPRGDLARRFGADLLQYLDRLSNRQPEPVAVQPPALRFRQRLTLPADTHSNKLILIAAERLLEEARIFLEMHAAATEQIRFDLWHVNRAYGSRSRTTLRVRSGKADRQPGRFLPQFEEQLGRRAIKQEVDAVSIMIDQIIPLQRTSEDLFSRQSAQTEDWSQLIDLITARLGDDRVYCLAHHPDHRPENAWKTTAVHNKPETQQDLTNLAPRPLWLLDSPRPLPRNSVTPRSEVERIEAGWWERQDIQRDYCIAEGNHQGDGWGWVYQNRRNKDQEQGWHLHGLFA